jgi:hypothetical protein
MAKLLKLTFAVPEELAGRLLVWAAEVPAQHLATEIVHMIGYNKNKPREKEDPRVKASKRDHNRNMREQIATKIIDALGKNAKLHANEVTAAIGEKYGYPFKFAMEELIRTGKVRKQNTGGGGPHKFLYSLAAPKQKPKRDYKAERETAKAKKKANSGAPQEPQAEGTTA